MNYHKISYDDQLNGEGLRVVLFLSGCIHYCQGCQNPQTWDPKSGQLFDKEALETIYHYMNKDYISGITLSGGDPFFKDNLDNVCLLCDIIHKAYPGKTIWAYTGYTFKQCYNDENRSKLLKRVDVLVDGRFVESLKDNNYKWAGSTNQKIINVQETLNQIKRNPNKNIDECIVLYETE